MKNQRRQSNHNLLHFKKTKIKCFKNTKLYLKKVISKKPQIQKEKNSKICVLTVAFFDFRETQQRDEPQQSLGDFNDIIIILSGSATIRSGWSPQFVGGR